MRVYIAGPMRGYPEHNFPAFDETRDRLWAAGYDVVSPADLTRQAGGFETQTEKGSLLTDIAALADCDVILMLPGWEASIGAQSELMCARWASIPVFLNETDLYLNRPVEFRSKEMVKL